MKTKIGKVFAAVTSVLLLTVVTSVNTFAVSNDDLEIEVPLSNEGQYVQGYSNAGSMVAEADPEKSNLEAESRIANLSAPMVPETSSTHSLQTATINSTNTSIFSSVAAQNATIGTAVIVILVGAIIALRARHKFEQQTLKVRKF